MTTATGFEHEYFCTPRPGEDGPRIEKYSAYRYNEQGYAVSTIQVVRCTECAAATYNGVKA